jgi:hypothetical protein
MHFLQSPEETLFTGDMSRRSHGTGHRKLSTSTPVFDPAGAERNPSVNPRYITNDGSKQALGVGCVGPKRPKDDSRYSEEY